MKAVFQSKEIRLQKLLSDMGAEEGAGGDASVAVGGSAGSRVMAGKWDLGWEVGGLKARLTCWRWGFIASCQWINWQRLYSTLLYLSTLLLRTRENERERERA